MRHTTSDRKTSRERCACVDTAYSKHKDRTPEQTVEVIRSILDELHIQTEVVALNHPFHGTYSNHVQIKGTTIGANGKGTTEAYARASGYAELLERIAEAMAKSEVSQAALVRALRTVC